MESAFQGSLRTLQESCMVTRSLCLPPGYAGRTESASGLSELVAGVARKTGPQQVEAQSGLAAFAGLSAQTKRIDTL